MSTWTRALVTGASSGIGRGLAEKLAASGADLVVNARGEQRLGDVAEKLRSHGVDVEVLAGDLTDGDDLDAVCERLESDERPVDLLVNNAGFGTAGVFDRLDVAGELAQVDLHLTATVRLSHAAAGRMARHGHGGILNVASLGGFQPMPFHTTYGATKAATIALSEALHEELRPSGVTVTALCPGFTKTAFHDEAGMDMRAVPDAAWLDVETVADAGLDGLEAGRAVAVPGARGKLLAALTRRTPDVLTRRAVDAAVRHGGLYNVDTSNDATGSDGRRRRRFRRALVTGASSGIGREMAGQLAAAGSDLVVVARSTAKLEDLAAELEDRHDTEVEVLTADLTDDGAVEQVADRLGDDDRPVDLLVNNAGINQLGRFVDLDVEGAIDQIRCNVTAAVRLTHAGIRAMHDRPGGGAVLLTSSTAGFQPLPRMAVYGATKNFLIRFGQALHEELRGTPVGVTVLCPGFTRTPFLGGDGSQIPGPLLSEPEDVARTGLRAALRGQAMATHGVTSKAHRALTKAIPSVILRRAAQRVY